MKTYIIKLYVYKKKYETFYSVANLRGDQQKYLFLQRETFLLTSLYACFVHFKKVFAHKLQYLQVYP